MTTSILIGIATLAGILILALGRRSRIGAVLGIVGLIATTALAATIQASDVLILGDVAIAGSQYVRLFLVLGGTAATILALIGLVVGSPSSIAGVALLTLAGAALALAVTDPTIAVLASTAAMVAAAVVVADRRSGPRITVAARALRSTVVGGLLAVGGMIWLATASRVAPVPGVEPVDGLGAAGLSEAFGPGLIGLAYLAVAIALAIRLGAIPFHGWAARIAEATPPAGLPATLALGPAAFAIVVIAWLDGSVGTLGEPLIIERWVVLGIAAASLVFGAVAAWLHDDIEHVVAYSLVQDAGVILLAVAALDPAAWASVRLWILSVIVVKSALAAWAAATRHAFGTRRVPELGGWARRSPVLAAAFVVVLVAIVGLPGLAAFEARADLIDLVAGGPFAALLVLGALAPIGYLGRILALGFGAPSPFVTAAAGPIPIWPRRDDAKDEPPSTPAPSSTASADPVAIARALPAAWRANRAPIAAALVLIVSGLAMATSAGSFGAISAAAEPAPGAGPIGPEGPGEPDASLPPAESPKTSLSPANGSEPPATPTTTEPASDGPPQPEPSAAEPGASPPVSFEPVPTQ